MSTQTTPATPEPRPTPPGAEKSLQVLIDEHLAAGTLDLPLINRTALRLQEIQHSDTVTIDEVTDIIRQDQALASRLLRVANSSFYGGLKQIETISAGVIRLGTERVASLALTASQALAHESREPMISVRMPWLWERSYTAAIGCHWLAGEGSARFDAEEGFMAGLLHDVGELYLLKVVELLLREEKLGARITNPLLDEVLEVMHADTGYRLMQQWSLPEKYAIVTRDHHDPEPDADNQLLMAVRLLDLAARKIGIGMDPDPDCSLSASLEAQVLGLGEIELARLEVRLEDALKEAGQLI